VRKSEGESGRRSRESDRDAGDSSSREHDAAVPLLLRQKPHPDGEEVRLERRTALEVGMSHGRAQQLPVGLLRQVRVDEHRRLRREVEVVVPAAVINAV